MNSCLVVIQNLTKSGSPQTFLHVIETLKKKGFVVDAFVYAVRDKGVDLYYFNDYRKVCRKIYISKIKLNGLSMKFFPFLKFFNIKRTIKKNRYNLVLSNSIYFIADCSAHKTDLNNPKLVFYSLGNVNIESRFAIIRKKERFVRKYIKNIDAYIALSSVAVPKDGIAPDGRLFMLMDYPNEYFPDISKEHDGNKIVLGQIGYYCSNKNQLFSLAILNELVNKGINARIVFIGFKLSEEPRYYSEILKFIHEHNLSSLVTFLPSDYDKRSFFENIDVLLLPSLFEGLSITLLEAQFSNTYCIASDRVPHEVDFGLCNFSLLDKEVWIKNICNFSNKRKLKPKCIYTKKDFDDSLSNIIDVIFCDEELSNRI